MDLAQLLGGGGSDPTGLLTPQQTGDINQTTLQGIAAGLLKASGPSPYKAGMTTLSGLGEALQGGLAARREAQKDAVTQSYVRTQTLDKVVPLLNLGRQYDEAGIPQPPALQNMIKIANGLIGGGALPTGAPAAAAGAATGGVPAPDSGVPRIMSMKEFAETHGFITPGQAPYALMKDSSQHAALQAAYEKYQDAVSPEKRASAQEAKVTEGDIEHYGKQYVGIQAARRAGEKILGLTDQAKAVVDLMEKTGYRPGGTIAPELQTAWRQFAANTGIGDSNAAFAPEVFKKVTQEALQGIQQDTAATAAEIGGSAGRNLLATVKLQLGSSPSTDITIPSNRYLLDQMGRQAQHSVNLGDEAIRYKAGHKFKRLDEGWDARESELNRAHKGEELQRLQTQGLAGLTQTPPAQAEGVRPIPGMMSPQGPGAGSGFLTITPGAAPPSAQPGAAAAPAARPTMQPGVIYPSHDGKSFIALIDGKITPVDAGGRPLGK